MFSDTMSELVQNNMNRPPAPQENVGNVLTPQDVNRVMPPAETRPLYHSNLLPDELQSDIINGRINKPALEMAKRAVFERDNPQYAQPPAQPQYTQPQTQTYNYTPPVRNETVQERPAYENVLNSFKQKLAQLKTTRDTAYQPQQQQQGQVAQQTIEPVSKVTSLDEFLQPGNNITQTNEAVKPIDQQQPMSVMDRLKATLKEDEFSRVSSGMEMGAAVTQNINSFREIAARKGYDPDEMQKRLLTMSHEEMIDLMAGKTNNKPESRYVPLSDLPGGTISNAPTVPNNQVQTQQGRPFRIRYEI